MIQLRLAHVVLTTLIFIPALNAQERAEEWQAARLNKVTVAQPSHRSGFESVLYQMKDRRVLERFQSGYKGLHPLLGGLATGSGLALGSEFRKEGLAGLNLTASAQSSLKQYQRYELGLELPQIGSSVFFAELNARQRNYPQERFYGTGADSSKGNRTNYRLEDTKLTATFGARPKSWLSAGVRGGVLNTNVGSGTDSRFQTTEAIFSENLAPGIEKQPHYYHSGAFVDVDYRDHRGNPRSGGHYSASVTAYDDQSAGRYSFNQLDVEAQQYFPFFNKRRVIAVRALATLTQTDNDQQVPFFMLPSIGGSDSLRGYQEYRFNDRNRVLVNAEYRWEVFSGLDMALFGDAGQVAKQASEFDLNKFKTSYGVGFRFNTARGVFLRVDIARSSEGQRAYVKFGHVF